MKAPNTAFQGTQLADAILHPLAQRRYQQHRALEARSLPLIR